MIELRTVKVRLIKIAKILKTLKKSTFDIFRSLQSPSRVEPAFGLKTAILDVVHLLEEERAAVDYPDGWDETHRENQILEVFVEGGGEDEEPYLDQGGEDVEPEGQHQKIL